MARSSVANNKKSLDGVFVISGIIKVEVSVISLSLRLRLITLTETLIIPDVTKTESNNNYCFIIHCFEENNDKCIIALPHKNISTLGLIPFRRMAPGYFSKVFVEQFLNHFCRSFIIFRIFIFKVVTQFLTGSMKRIERPFLLCCS